MRGRIAPIPGILQLSVDSSTAYAGLALSRDGQLLAEHTWRAERDHSRTLMPAIVRLLEEHGAQPQDIGSLAVATGPGSFNGLRVGLAVVKGLALALAVPVVGVSTLAVAAFPHVTSGLPVCAVQDAGRKELAAAIFQQRDAGFICLVEEQILSPEALVRRMVRRTFITGEVPDWAAAALRDGAGGRALFVTPALAVRRPAALAELGWQRLARGDYDDPAALQPLYLRRPSITQPRTTLG